jgi:nitrite reductase/ring-hydroxylating ferredoxin subunit
MHASDRVPGSGASRTHAASAAVAPIGAEPPRSWYFLTPSAALRPGSSNVVPIGGRDVLVFRTEAGHVRATSNVCPHLGAQLGAGGRVVGETFECPLHRRRYALSTGPTDAAGIAGVLPGLPVREGNGLVLVWIAPSGEPPAFALPRLDEEGWTAPVFRTYEFATSAATIIQDLADVEHFTTVHGYRDVSGLEPFASDGASLRVGYAVLRRLGHRIVGYDQRVRFWSRAYGLGYQVTEVESFGGLVRTRHFVLPTPIDARRSRVALGLSVRLGRAPAGRPHPLARLLRAPIMRSFVHDIQLDARAWEARYPVASAIEPEEPDLRVFRRWVTQFDAAAAS